MKRLFDIVVSVAGLFFLSPLFAVIALAIKIESRGPVFFRGERIGRDAKPFRIFKFRTMVADAAQRGGGLTTRGDPRVTPLGRLLRRTKLDELPQLINVVRGEMSLVGPRPEDPRYLAYYTARQRSLLSVRPGITSIASIRYRNEEQLLSPARWEKTYVETVLPAKLDIELRYLAVRSFGQDLLILLATLFALFADESHFDAWSGAIGRLEHLIGRYGSWVVVDIPLIVAAYALALAVRSINARIDFPLAFLEALVGVAVYIASNYGFGIYKRFWSYASSQEAVALFVSAMTATGLLLLVDLMLQERVLPLIAVGLGGFFTFIFFAAVRYRRHLTKGIQQMFGGWMGFASGKGARVLIVGATDTGQLLARQLQNQLDLYQVVAFVDDARAKHGMRIHNVPVFGGRLKIPELVARLHVDLILIAIPLAQTEEPQELLNLCRATSAEIRMVPTLKDMLTRNGHGSGWEQPNDADLLQRVLHHIDEESCRNLVADRVVMVTGAAGSIGSELCRQISAFAPRRLVLVDIDESGLHDLKVELHAKSKTFSVELVLCDISQACRLQSVFERTRPNIVFHAAAYKHVPILEEYPHEAIRVNVLGTQLLYSLAQAYGVERLILISSDKAVNPCNVLGMTKWIGELIVTATPHEGPLLSAAVRFGNVLRSRGSAVLTFERQIELGGPLTITDPKMTRYFLTLDEAVSLVIQAAAMTHGGEVFVLDMGIPVNILELAHRMIRQRGLRPGQDIAIEFIGPRPGEKTSEELVAIDEERLPTDHPSISRLSRVSPLHLAQFDRQINRLVSSSQNGATPEAVRTELWRCVQSMGSHE